MSDLRVKSDISTVTRYTDDDKWMNLRGLRDGAMVECDWLLGLALEGKVFCANGGTGTSPITVNAGFTAAKPDFLITVPDGTTIIPVFIEMSMEDTGTVEDFDVMAVASSVYDNAVTGTSITAYPMRLNAGTSTGCGVYSKVTAGGTTPYTGNFLEFFRAGAGMAEDAFNGNTAPTNELVSRAAWGAKEVLCPPIIVGEGSLNIYTSTQGGVSFITVMWVELASTGIV